MLWAPQGSLRKRRGEGSALSGGGGGRSSAGSRRRASRGWGLEAKGGKRGCSALSSAQRAQGWGLRSCLRFGGIEGVGKTSHCFSGAKFQKPNWSGPEG